MDLVRSLHSVSITYLRHGIRLTPGDYRIDFWPRESQCVAIAPLFGWLR